MHITKRKEKITGTGGKDKVVVMGMLERDGEVKTQVIARPTKKALQAIIQESVVPGSRPFSDALKSYEGLDTYFQHKVIDHAVSYVEDNVHTNGVENY